MSQYVNMSLPTNLNTNEVKSSAGTEIEFIRMGADISNPRSMVFQYANEIPGRPFRITAAHKEQGEGRQVVRRSLWKTEVKCDPTTLVDATIDSRIKVTTVMEVPQGNLLNLTQVKDLGAAHGSSLMSRGADSTILFNCTGVGMEAIVNGTL